MPLFITSSCFAGILLSASFAGYLTFRLSLALTEHFLLDLSSVFAALAVTGLLCHALRTKKLLPPHSTPNVLQLATFAFVCGALIPIHPFFIDRHFHTDYLAVVLDTAPFLIFALMAFAQLTSLVRDCLDIHHAE